MNFKEAVISCFSNYVSIKGRAPRSEYWHWMLFIFLASFCTMTLDNAFFSESYPLYTITLLVSILPSWCVSIRRLHDLDRSGWWVLILCVPLIGLIGLIWFMKKGTDGYNRFGAPRV